MKKTLIIILMVIIPMNLYSSEKVILVNETIKTGASSQEKWTYYGNSKILIRQSDYAYDILMNFNSETVIFIDHKNTKYAEISLEYFNKTFISGPMKQLLESKPKITNTGKKEKIGKYSCMVHEISYPAFGTSSTTYFTAISFRLDTVYEIMLKSGFTGNNEITAYMKKNNYLPVLTVTKTANGMVSETKLKEIREISKSEIFNIPTDYNKVDFE